MKTSTRILAVVTVILFALSMLLIIGTDSDWGKVELTRMTLTSADGDEISAMLYKPKTATPDNPAPAVLYAHGGSDMLEQGGTYALELARRGYVVETWQVWKHDGYEISRNLLCTSRYRAYQETWEYN